VACQAAGFSEIQVTARRFSPELPREQWPGGVELTALGAELVPWPAAGPAFAEAFAESCSRASLLVQCTSAGMHGADSGEPIARLVPWQRVPDGALAYDLIYAPLETPFLRAAREAGKRTSHGLGMLVGQAALAIELWLGQRPALEPLMNAALAELERRRSA
jgi:shikimate 5-dehydrogenase